jgi:beta-aspartyl-peptidase (threonine type)
LRLCGDALDLVETDLLAELGRIGGKGGFIAVTPDGTARWAFNTPGMYRGMAAQDRAPHVAIFGDE